MEELAREASEAGPSPEQQRTLKQQALALAEKEREIEDTEARLERLKKQRLEMRHKTIPDMMQEIKQDRVGLPDFGEHGADVVLRPYFFANLPKIDEKTGEGIGPEPGLNWLEESGHGGIIRTTVTVVLGKEELPLARSLQVLIPLLPRLADKLSLKGLDEHTVAALELLQGRNEAVPTPAVARTIPWATLTAFVKEQTLRRREEMSNLEDGEEPETPELPLDLLGAIVGMIAEVKLRKR